MDDFLDQSDGFSTFCPHTWTWVTLTDVFFDPYCCAHTTHHHERRNHEPRLARACRRYAPDVSTRLPRALDRRELSVSGTISAFPRDKRKVEP